MHVAGLGAGGVALRRSRVLSWRDPFHRLKFKVYVSTVASTMNERQINSSSNGSSASLEPAAARANQVADVRQTTTRDGSEKYHKTEFYVPNDYVVGICRFAA